MERLIDHLLHTILNAQHSAPSTNSITNYTLWISASQRVPTMNKFVLCSPLFSVKYLSTDADHPINSFRFIYENSIFDEIIQLKINSFLCLISNPIKFWFFFLFCLRYVWMRVGDLFFECQPEALITLVNRHMMTTTMLLFPFLIDIPVFAFFLKFECHWERLFHF